jgi:hypothetical protein
MTPTRATILSAPCLLLTDEHARPAAIRTQPAYDLAFLPVGWSIHLSTMHEALDAIIAEDKRKRAVRNGGAR